MPVQRLNIAFLLLDLPLFCRNQFRGNYSDWRVSKVEAGRNIRKRRLGNEKVTTIEICNLES